MQKTSCIWKGLVWIHAVTTWEGWETKPKNKAPNIKKKRSLVSETPLFQNLQCKLHKTIPPELQ